MRLFYLTLILVVLLAACQVGPTISPPATSPADPAPTVVTPSLRPTLRPSVLPTQVSTPTSSSKIPVKVEELRGVQVDFWHGAVGSLSNEIDAVVKEFNQTNIWGITVNALSQGSNAGLEEAIGGLENDATHPLVVAARPEAIAHFQVQNHRFLELSPYFSDPQWGLSPQEMADFYPDFWDSGTVNGQQLSIPLLRSLSILFYNQTWAKALGFQGPPVTTADFQNQACAAAKANLLTGVADNAGTGGWIVDTNSAAILSWLSAFEEIPAQPQALPFSFNTTQTASAFGFLRNLIDKNCAWNGRNSTPYAYFAQNKALFYSGMLEDIPFQQKAMLQQKSSDTWVAISYPNGGKAASMFSFGPSLAIVQAKPNEDLAAWLFLRWLILPRNQSRLAAAGSMLPVGKSAIDLMNGYKVQNVQWAQAAGWLNQTQAAFPQSWWFTSQPVLEDAAWQIFQPFTTPASIPDVLKELDATITELLQH